eukprot:1184384-Amphidinium_carterae.2
MEEYKSVGDHGHSTPHPDDMERTHADLRALDRLGKPLALGQHFPVSRSSFKASTWRHASETCLPAPAKSQACYPCAFGEIDTDRHRRPWPNGEPEKSWHRLRATMCDPTSCMGVQPQPHLCLLFVDLTDAFTTAWRPPEIIDLLRTAHTGTSLEVLTAHGCTKLLTTLGLKQGCVLASWLFGVFLDAAKRSIQADLETTGLLQSLPAVSDESFLLAQADASLAVTSLDWVDDMVSPRWAKDPLQGLQECKHAYGITLAALRRFHLRPNLQKGKTEMMITLKGKNARAVQLGLKRDGKVTLCSGDALRVTTTYKHLGRLLTDRMSDFKDTVALAAASRQAPLKLNKILKNQSYPASLKVQLVSCMAISKYTSSIQSSRMRAK